MRPNFLVVCLLGWIIAGCPRSYVDDDLEAKMARQIILDMEVQDALNTKQGDKTDWKRVVPMGDGKVTLTFVVGDPFVGSHDLMGDITVFDSNKDKVARAQLDSMTTQYKLAWEATAESAYWVRFRANSGQAKYTVSYKQKRLDPCDKCRGEERCVDGRCVAPEIEPCGGPCPRGKTCNVTTNRCTSNNPCRGVRCPSGKVCRGGVCKKKALPSTGCRPACSSKQRCVRNRCVKKQVVKDGPTVVRYNVKVISRSAAGNTTYLVLNKGSAHGVKVGDKGAIAGMGFRVIEVYGVRCKVRVNAPISKLGGKTSGYLKATR